MGRGGVIFLVTGGIAYTIGSILYGLGKKRKWMHSIFHLFILAGSILHFFAIVLYAL
jgi:hemolysin III